MIFRGDSNDSNHSSVGDIPIELPHLEDDDDMYNIHLFNKSKKSLAGTLPDRSEMIGHRGRSRSLGKLFPKSLGQGLLYIYL